MPQFLRRLQQTSCHFQFDVRLDVLHVPEGSPLDTIYFLLLRKGKKSIASDEYYVSEDSEVYLGEILTTYITLYQDKNGDFQDKQYDLELRSFSTNKTFARFSLNASKFCSENCDFIIRTLNNELQVKGNPQDEEYKLTVSVACKYQSAANEDDLSDVSSTTSLSTLQTQKRGLSTAQVSECQPCSGSPSLPDNRVKILRTEVSVHEYDQLLKDLTTYRSPDRFSRQASPNCWDVSRNETILRLEKELAEALHDYQTMVHELQNVTQEKNEIAAEFEALKAHVTESDFEEQITNMRIELLQKKSFADEMARKLQKSQEQRRKLTNDLNEALRVQDIQSERINSLADQLEEKGDQSAVVHRFRYRLVEAEEAACLLDKKLSKVQSERDIARAKCGTSLSEKEELVKEISSLKTQLCQQACSITTLQHEKSILEQKLDESYRNIDERNANLSKVAINNTIQKDLDDAIRICDQNAIEIDAMKKTIEEKERQYEQAKGESARLDMQLKQSRQQISGINKQLLKAQKENHEMSEELRRMRGLLSSDEVDVEDFRALLQEKEIREDCDVVQLNNKLSDAEHRISELESSLSEAFNLTMEKNALLSKLMESESERFDDFSNRKEKQQELEAQLAYHEEHIKVLEAALESSEADQEVYRARCEAYEKKLSQTLVKITLLESEIKSSKTAADKAVVRSSQLEISNEKLKKSASDADELCKKLLSNTRIKKLENEAIASKIELDRLKAAAKTASFEKGFQKKKFNVLGGMREPHIKDMKLSMSMEEEMTEMSADVDATPRCNASVRNTYQSGNDKKKSSGRILSWVRR